jgi:hypothetical protein
MWLQMDPEGVSCKDGNETSGSEQDGQRLDYLSGCSVFKSKAMFREACLLRAIFYFSFSIFLSGAGVAQSV